MHLCSQLRPGRGRIRNPIEPQWRHIKRALKINCGSPASAAPSVILCVWGSESMCVCVSVCPILMRVRECPTAWAASTYTSYAACLHWAPELALMMTMMPSQATGAGNGNQRPARQPSKPGSRFAFYEKLICFLCSAIIFYFFAVPQHTPLPHNGLPLDCAANQSVWLIFRRSAPQIWFMCMCARVCVLCVHNTW